MSDESIYYCIWYTDRNRCVSYWKPLDIIAHISKDGEDRYHLVREFVWFRYKQYWLTDDQIIKCKKCNGGYLPIDNQIIKYKKYHGGYLPIKT